MVRRNEFHRCKFCINWNEYTESCPSVDKCDMTGLPYSEVITGKEK